MNGVMKTITALTVLAILLLAVSAASAQEPGKQTAVDMGLHYKYLLYLPSDYGEAGRHWPMILFLHGAGERGSNLTAVKTHGPPKYVDNTVYLTRGILPQVYQFIIVSPQCPSGEWWSNDHLIPLLNEVIADYAVDRNRIYVTGLSMGGFGTWSLASVLPDKFAAIAPICGGGDAWGLLKGNYNTTKEIPAAIPANLVKIPIWAFHGGADTTVPTVESQKMADAVKAAGGNVLLTIYPNVGHDSWTQTYSKPEIYNWFLENAILTGIDDWPIR
ncbi:MAG: prolyl oligopeptidase family serine peptidase [Candidatus Omnitrophota bacterium]